MYLIPAQVGYSTPLHTRIYTFFFIFRGSRLKLCDFPSRNFEPSMSPIIFLSLFVYKYVKRFYIYIYNFIVRVFLRSLSPLRRNSWTSLFVCFLFHEGKLVVRRSFANFFFLNILFTFESPRWPDSSVGCIPRRGRNTSILQSCFSRIRKLLLHQISETELVQFNF